MCGEVSLEGLIDRAQEWWSCWPRATLSVQEGSEGPEGARRPPRGPPWLCLRAGKSGAQGEAQRRDSSRPWQARWLSREVAAQTSVESVEGHCGPEGQGGQEPGDRRAGPGRPPTECSHSHRILPLCGAMCGRGLGEKEEQGENNL